MAKEGIGYFSLDTDFFHSDKKVKIIKGEFGAKGVIILLYTLCAIYSDKGYYMEWENDDCYLMSDDLGCDCSPNLIGEVINRCVKRGIFNEEVFNAFGVLTSHGIQIRFLKAAAKREKIKIIEEYALFDFEELKEGMRNKVTFFSNKVARKSEKVARKSEKVASCDTKKESKASKESKVKRPPISPTVTLEQFLSAYPLENKQINLHLTEIAYIDCLMTGQVTEQELLAAARNYADRCQILETDSCFVKKPENFIRDLEYCQYLPSVYEPPKKPKGKSKWAPSEQNSYDFDALEKELLSN